MKTLTLAEACELISDARRSLDALLDLQERWIGHRETDFNGETLPELADMLCEHVSECADETLRAAWDSRGGRNPPAADDDTDTGLVSP